MSNKNKVGELRPSQIMYSFGIGAVVDLPNMSVIVMGLDDWDTQYATPIGEERLLAKVRSQPHLQQVSHLRQAPLKPNTETFINPFDENSRVGLPVSPFPTWVLCPECRLIASLASGLFQIKVNFYRPEETHYKHTTCPRAKAPTVIPARFLAACTKGHLDDFPWMYFVHQTNTDCNGILKLEERGVSGTAADVWIRCEECGKSRSMSQSFGDLARNSMPKCRGRQPHLRNFDEDECDEQMKTILLGASNSWFAVALSALSIPKFSSELTRLIEKRWHILQNANSLETFQAIYQVLQATGQLSELYKYSQEKIWLEIEKKRNGQEQEQNVNKDLKTPEWEVFSVADKTNNNSDFQLESVAAPKNYERFFEKVVLIEKMREVRALIGFTRIESPYDYQEQEELLEWGRLSRNDPRWVPASEIRGEGIFIQFSEKALLKWEKENSLLDEYKKKNFEASSKWRQARNLPPQLDPPGWRYSLIHSFSHALMRQLAIECGYGAASLRERIYAKTPEEENGPMAGVLIYTASPDSEGTLGGLVSLGEPDKLGRHIEQALEQMRLCASDPLCAEHDPLQGNVSLHWAACHACLFSPETSCERGNKYLDRSLLIPSVKTAGLAFFVVE